jgi:chemotaxis protein histidine kinase CheA
MVPDGEAFSHRAPPPPNRLRTCPRSTLPPRKPPAGTPYAWKKRRRPHRWHRSAGNRIPGSPDGTQTTLRRQGQGDESPPGETNLRVNITLLDSLMNLAGELVLGRNQLIQAVSSNDFRTVQGTAQRLDLITSELAGGDHADAYAAYWKCFQ